MFTLKRRGTAERIIRCSSKEEISLSSDFFGGFLEVVAFLLFFNSLSWSIRWKNRKRCFFLGNLVAMQWLVMRLLIILWLFRRWSGTPGFGKMDDFPEKSRRLLRKWKFNLRLKKWESHVEVATFAFLNLTIFSWWLWFWWFLVTCRRGACDFARTKSCSCLASHRCPPWRWVPRWALATF